MFRQATISCYIWTFICIYRNSPSVPLPSFIIFSVPCNKRELVVLKASMGSTEKYSHDHKARLPTKEEDDEACLYAMLLSSFQVFPGILNAAIELKVLDKMSEKAGEEEGGDYFMSVSEIASQLPTQHSELHDRLDRMLRVLASFKVLDWTTRNNQHGQVERLYKLSLAGSYFLHSTTESLASFSNLQCHPATTKVWYVSFLSLPLLFVGHYSL